MSSLFSELTSGYPFQERGCRITIESDEDIDAGFSCLLEENGTGNLHFLPASFIFEDFTISKVILHPVIDQCAY